MMFKKYAFFLAIFFAIPAFSQDKIYKADGDVIDAKVISVGTAQIGYKRYDNQSGHVSTILKRNVVKIVYQNGPADNFEPTSRRPGAGHAKMKAPGKMQRSEEQ